MKRLELVLCCLAVLTLLTRQVICTATTGEPEAEAEPPLRHLTVTSILVRPWLCLQDPPASGNEGFTGFIADLVKDVAERANFNYTLTQVIDGLYGRKDETTHKWTGMIGELIDDAAQMAAAPLIITPARSHVVTFTKPWMNVSLAALVPSGSGINTLRELEQHEPKFFGTIEGGSSMEAFRYSQEDLIQDMWLHIGGDHSTNVASVEEGIKYVKNGNFSFILEKPMAEYYANTEWGLYMLDETFLDTGGYGLAVQEGDRIINDLNDALASMKKDGTIDRLYTKWFQDVERCSASGIAASLLLLTLALVIPWL